MPVHAGDADQARRTLELSLKLKFQTSHWLIVEYPQSAIPYMQPVLEAARRAFKNVIDYMIPAEVRDGWPYGPNQMFYEAIAYLYQANEADRASKIIQMDPKMDNGRFLWWEPDAIPLHSNWIDRLETEYNISGKPFMGAKVETWKYQFPYVKDAEGKVVLNEFDNARKMDTSAEPIGKVRDGINMSGVAIYPRAFFTIIEWAVRSLRNNGEPFDVLFKNEICRQLGDGNYYQFQPTYLIAHNTRSTNYRIVRDIDGTYVVSDPDPKFPSGNPKFLWSQDGSVGAVLAHGCKDGSLEKVVLELNGLNKSVSPVEFTPSGRLPQPAFIENDRVAKNADAMISDEGALTDAEQALLQKLIKKAAVAQNRPPQASKERKAPDVSKINAEAFYASLDAKGWRAALTENGVSPTQGKVLKDMRISTPA